MSIANSQESSKPKSPTEDIAEYPPRQLAPSVGILHVNSIVSADTNSSALTRREDPMASKHVNMIQKGGLTKRDMKKLTREMHMAETVVPDIPEYLGWSDQAITFGLEDHPHAVPRPGHAALVLEVQIGGFRMNKVLMDGGSSINIIFLNTLHAMRLSPEALFPSGTIIYGIVPAGPAYPLGKISLEVVFGNPHNFRKERLEFEVIDWESQYHALLGRPAYAKFMAVPHYAYLQLKMPGNNGTPLVIHGNFRRSDHCEKEFDRITRGFWRKEHLALADKVDYHQPPPDDRRRSPDEFNPVEQTKKLQVHPTDASKTVNVSKTLTNDQEGELIKFLRERWEIFAWEPADMPGIPREFAEHALNVNPNAKPVQQAMRRYSEPRRIAMSSEAHPHLYINILKV